MKFCSPGSCLGSLFVWTVSSLLINKAIGHKIRLVNGCFENTSVSILNKALLECGGFRLNAGQTRALNSVPPEWAGRFWGRTGCNSNGQNCETGVCGVEAESSAKEQGEGHQ